MYEEEEFVAGTRDRYLNTGTFISRSHNYISGISADVRPLERDQPLGVMGARQFKVSLKPLEHYRSFWLLTGLREGVPFISKVYNESLWRQMTEISDDGKWRNWRHRLVKTRVNCRSFFGDNLRGNIFWGLFVGFVYDLMTRYFLLLCFSDFFLSLDWWIIYATILFWLIFGFLFYFLLRFFSDWFITHRCLGYCFFFLPFFVRI